MVRVLEVAEFRAGLVEPLPLAEARDVILGIQALGALGREAPSIHAPHRIDLLSELSISLRRGGDIRRLRASGLGESVTERVAHSVLNCGRADISNEVKKIVAVLNLLRGEFRLDRSQLRRIFWSRIDRVFGGLHHFSHDVRARGSRDLGNMAIISFEILQSLNGRGGSERTYD